MPDPHDPKQQLQCWASAYGGDQLARTGYAGAEALAGTAPRCVDPEADRVERIVQRMESQGRWREARVLRAEYFMAGLPESERLQRLSRIGVSIGRSAYYAYLKSAIAFVEGALTGEPA
ncbi:hypothetical protein [Rhodanobacter sp. OR92]|uniref:hypothetical protein n=1 Tax=Rhodanobacter sp. OR92 TaxID=1076524 RepID=UPI0003FC549D|nr:hypothetical protein [Rhodanobacter sp. OR92]